MIIGIALGEADTVGSFRAGNDDFLDAEFAGRFDHIVCAEDVATEAFAVWHEEISGIGCEVDHCVGFLNADAAGAAGVLVVGKVEVGGEGVVDLAGVREVGFESMDCGMREREEVDIQDRVAFREEIRDAMAWEGLLDIQMEELFGVRTTGFTASTREDNTFPSARICH